jgi:nucleotide-binding universal stress UspA family protein
MLRGFPQHVAARPGCCELARRGHCVHGFEQGGIEMNDNRPILFATDGSPSAQEAQKEAFELAQRCDAPLLVVAVVHAALPPVGYGGYGYSNVVAELTEAEGHRVQKLLGVIEASACAANLRCSTVTADGFPVEEICRIAGERDAQLIVVGSHGWGAVRRLLSGSVSTGLVHQAPCPVLVVRGREQAHEHAAAA